VVEADERVGDDEPALRKLGAGRRERHGRLEDGDVVVAQVADDRPAGGDLALRFVESDEAPTGAEQAVAAETPLLDGLEQEAGPRARAQP
jgi:hypothetical protein